MYKRISAALLILVISSLLFSCAKEEKYRYCEMLLPLEERFEKADIEGFDVSYTDGECAVGVLRISYDAAYTDGIPDTLNESQFASFWLRKTGVSAEVKTDGNIVYAHYYQTDIASLEMYYLAAFYRSAHAYFVVLFGAQNGGESAWRVKFLDYANNVFFTED